MGVEVSRVLDLFADWGVYGVDDAACSGMDVVV